MVPFFRGRGGGGRGGVSIRGKHHGERGKKVTPLIVA